MLHVIKATDCQPSTSADDNSFLSKSISKEIAEKRHIKIDNSRTWGKFYYTDMTIIIV